MTTNHTASFDPIVTSILANRLDSIIREMTNTLLRAARSAVISSARDFSCAIVTADNELLACAEGLPVHIYGAHRQAADMTNSHPDLAEGDAFLDNNPYGGNSHAADHALLVPVFFEGEHMFTAVAKAHQADLGNSIPTSYHASAKDVYEEGALIFPSVRVQRDYVMQEDIIRMCRARIRVPGQWYGDFLAALGAARVAERRLKELCDKYGKDVIKAFTANWLEYSERLMEDALRKLPEANFSNSGEHDAFHPYLPDGLPFNVHIETRPHEGRIIVDLTDNLPNVDCGLNMTESTTMASVFGGIFNAIPTSIPKNAGSFRRVEVRLKQGAAIGIPDFPHSCSVATTNLADRLINCVGAAFAQLGAPYGVSEGAVGNGVGYATISGKDSRYDSQAFVSQIVMAGNGGPASPAADGWLTWGLPCVSGLMYRDSVEIDELKIPIQYKHIRIMPDTAGAGKLRGGPSLDIAFGPKDDAVSVIYPCDGEVNPPKGAAGGQDGGLASGWLLEPGKEPVRLPNNVYMTLEPGQLIRGIECSGGGYGDPLDRDPLLVLHDVQERWVTAEHAESVYGVAILNLQDEQILDTEATHSLRASLRAQSPVLVEG